MYVASVHVDLHVLAVFCKTAFFFPSGFNYWLEQDFWVSGLINVKYLEICKFLFPFYRLMFQYDLFILRNYSHTHCAVLKPQELRKGFKAVIQYCRSLGDVPGRCVVKEAGWWEHVIYAGCAWWKSNYAPAGLLTTDQLLTLYYLFVTHLQTIYGVLLLWDWNTAKTAPTKSF